MRVSKRLPLAFMMAAAIILSFEIGVHLLDDQISLDFLSLTSKEKGRMAETESQCLIFGDSDLIYGINPLEIKTYETLNLSVPAFEPICEYLMFKRHLKRTVKKPEIIILGRHAVGWGSNEDRNTKFAFGEFVRFSELLSVFFDTEPYERALFLKQKWKTRTRARMLSKLPLVLLEKDSLNRSSPRPRLKAMAERKGYLRRSDAGSTKEMDSMYDYKEFVIKPRTMKYFDLNIRLAKEHDIKIIYLQMPVKKSVYDMWSSSGFLKQYYDFMTRLKSRYPDIVFLTYPDPYLDDDFYADSTHLNDQGASIVSRWLDSQLFKLKSGSAD